MKIGKVDIITTRENEIKSKSRFIVERLEFFEYLPTQFGKNKILEVKKILKLNRYLRDKDYGYPLGLTMSKRIEAESFDDFKVCIRKEMNSKINDDKPIKEFKKHLSSIVETLKNDIYRVDVEHIKTKDVSQLEDNIRIYVDKVRVVPVKRFKVFKHKGDKE